MPNKIITGLFASPADAARAVQLLEARGTPPQSISLIANDKFDREAFAITESSKMPEGMAAGATVGTAIGALVGGLTAVGTIATGGVGLLAAGPVVAALAGAGAGAAGGTIIGGLIGARIPEHEIKHYEESIDKGSVLVGVDVGSAEMEVATESVFEACEAERISRA